MKRIVDKKSLFVTYGTELITSYIVDYIKKNEKFFHISNIETEAGMYNHQLLRTVSGQFKSINPDSLKKLLPILEQMGFRTPCINFTVEEILKAVSYSSHLPVELIRSKTRRREVVQERQIAIHLCSLHGANKSDNFIAKELDYDHNTIRHAKKTVNNLYETDKLYKEKVDKYEKDLLNK